MELDPGPGPTPDPTEPLRRELIPQMPAQLAEARARGEQVWTADEMAKDFEALSFMAPFVVVRRLADNVRGILMFTGEPPFYFGWESEISAPQVAPPTPSAPRPRVALFQFGRVVASRGALATMARKGIDPLQLLARHVTGDWGDLGTEDKRANDLAVQRGERIRSCYGTQDDPDRIWIITGADRGVTTIRGPETRNDQ